MREWLGLYSSLGSSSSLNYKMLSLYGFIGFCHQMFDPTYSDCGDAVSSVEKLFAERKHQKKISLKTSLLPERVKCKNMTSCIKWM